MSNQYPKAIYPGGDSASAESAAKMRIVANEAEEQEVLEGWGDTDAPVLDLSNKPAKVARKPRAKKTDVVPAKADETTSEATA